eukprot:CAMPEP_0194495736 /NCGR_PEP_ID=MMETSP0253-20130528/13232_1 /TAXON_ID=2966 /ORGANISM="Noctiluca scintillans" /LENGTH=484 /DNA_ID=CAMNT_0039337037 /DNA_START=33 /DNA_END=1484 /DNA_ORIENTATION=-
MTVSKLTSLLSQAPETADKGFHGSITEPFLPSAKLLSRDGQSASCPHVSLADMEGQSLSWVQEKHQGNGTVLTSSLSLISTSMGTGILALPFALAASGTVRGIVLLMAFAMVSGLSSYVYCQCCDWAKIYTYEGVVAAALGRRGAMGLEVAVVWLLLGAMTSLLVVSGDTLEFAVNLLLSNLYGEGSLLPGGRPLIVASALCCVMIPLSWRRSTHALRFANGMAVACVLFISLTLTGRGILLDSTYHGHQRTLVVNGTFLNAVPIIMLSYGCQVQVPQVYSELKQRSLSRMRMVFFYVGACCFAFYAVVGIMGVAAVGGPLVADTPQAGVPAHDVLVPGNVLSGLPLHDMVALSMRLAMAISVTLVYPMLCLPCRSAIDHLLFAGLDEKRPASQWAKVVRHAVETLGIAGLAFFFACSGADLAHVFGFTGATAGAVICYILPPACFLKLRKMQPEEDQAVSTVLSKACILIIFVVVPLSVLLTW